MTMRTYIAALFVAVCSSQIAAGDWTRFRGPNGSGVSADSAPTPVKWSPDENLKWKTILPGAGISCPIVVSDKVLLTCYSGYGADGGEMEDLKRHLVCVQADSGKILWDKTVKAVLPEDPYTGMGIPAHGYASHTPISDGKRIYVFFGKSGALAFDMEGKQLWQTSVGTESDPRRWGSSSSPVLFDNLLIVTAAAESQALVALNTETGNEVWRQEATGFDNTWGTPVLVKVDDERTDLVLGVPYEIWGFNPSTGKLAWYAEAMESDQFSSSVIAQDGIVYAIEGRGGGSIALKVGGKGDVTKTNVVWSGRDSSRFGTPVIYKDRIYYVGNGIANCIDAKTGKRVFQGRLQGGSTNAQVSSGAPPAGAGNRDQGRGGFDRGRGGFGRGGFGRGRGGFGNMDYSSPVIADGKLYYIKGSGDMYVLKLGDKFEQLAVNRVTDDREKFGATPAISDGRLFIRSDKHLYCVASK